MHVDVEIVRRKGPFWKMAGRISVDSTLVCEAEMTAMVSDEEDE